MDKERIRKFKNRQKRIAKKIAKEIGIPLCSVEYQQYLTGAKRDYDDPNKIILEEKSQIVIPDATIRPATYKKRIKIIFIFKGNLKEEDKKIINPILKTQYKLKGNTIRFSVNPQNKNSI